jgi:phage N-6-adenine-methyltransferase
LELDKAQGARTELLPAAGQKSKADALSDAGLSTSAANRYEQLAGGSRDEQVQEAGKAGAEAYFAKARAEMEPATMDGLREAVQEAVHAAMGSAPKRHHRTIGTGDNEWYTPAIYIDLAREVLGDIDLDPASSELANATVQAQTFYTQEDDGLTKRWIGRVWINPPFSKELIGKFVDKLTEEFEANNVSAAILLTNDSTDTAWFHAAFGTANAICFHRGRIEWVQPDGNVYKNTAYGQTFFYFGPNPAAFNRVFREIGFVVQPFGDDANGDA